MPLIAKLKALVSDNPSQESKASQMEKNINNLLQFWKDRGNDASKYTWDIITRITDDEKRQMDEIRGNINDLLQAKNTLLTGRGRNNTNSIKRRIYS